MVSLMVRMRCGDYRTRRKKGGPCLGSRAPIGRVPVVRPRRDRTMGSSILASLSEAGGNDPCYPMNGPLPPHSPDKAHRVGTQPAPDHMQVGCPSDADRAI